MKKTYLLSIILLILFCACSKDDNALDNIENSMIEKPEWTLTALADMDTLSMSELQKARRALLQAYMAAVYVIPIEMTAADLNRATSAFDGDCTTDEVKSLIIKSELAKADGNPVVRLEILKDAEFLASQFADQKTNIMQQ